VSSLRRSLTRCSKLHLHRPPSKGAGGHARPLKLAFWTRLCIWQRRAKRKRPSFQTAPSAKTLDEICIHAHVSSKCAFGYELGGVYDAQELHELVADHVRGSVLELTRQLSSVGATYRKYPESRGKRRLQVPHPPLRHKGKFRLPLFHGASSSSGPARFQERSFVLSHEWMARATSVLRSSGSEWPASRFVTERSRQARRIVQLVHWAFSGRHRQIVSKPICPLASLVSYAPK
jgi:hypothetical protein